jgi:hypothetical protein
MTQIIRRAVLALLLIAGITPVVAQTFPTVPDHSVIGRLGAGGQSGPSSAISFDRLSSQLGVVNTGWYVVGSSQYPTAAAAVAAAKAAHGGVVYFPCNAVSLGSGAIGLDLRGANFVRLVGAWSVGSGAAVCGGGGITYSGTGTAIDITGTQGVEISGLAIVALSASTVIKADGAIQTAFAKISRNTIFGKTSATGICISFANIITSVVEGNSINCYGINGNVGDVSNAIDIGPGNIFQPGNTFHLQNAVTWNVFGNTFEGNASGNTYGQSSGVSGCFWVNFTGNTVDDPVAVAPSLGLIETNCKAFNSKGNNYAASPSQAAIVLTAGSSSKVHSDGDYFNLNSTAININTGNCAQVDNYVLNGAVVTLIAGTAGCTQNPVSWTYGGAVISNILQIGVGAPGNLVFANATSGTITLVPATGALGSAVATLPAGTYNVVGDNSTQTLTNKTINGASNTLNVRIGSDVSGMGAGVATFLGTPSGANLAAALTTALPITKGGTGVTTGAVVSVKRQKFTAGGTYTACT